MYLVDANVLVYCVDSSSPHHEASRRWLSHTLTTPGNVVAMPWICLLAFIRLTTNPALYASPLSPTEATDIVRLWLAAPGVVTPEPSARHADLLAGLIGQAGTAANLTNDAHLAALALEHDAMIVTFDRDLARFGVRVVQPG